jgi:hypothetical protein
MAQAHRAPKWVNLLGSLENQANGAPLKGSKWALMDTQSVLKQKKQVEVWEGLEPAIGKKLSKEGLNLESSIPVCKNL